MHIFRTPKSFLENPERFFVTVFITGKPLGRVFT
jgi:hypothetical protein